MGKIFYIMGKSASGKDSIYAKLKNDESLNLKRIVRYTTRPPRSGEENGREYFFVDDNYITEASDKGNIIEKKTYETVYGPWTYAMIEDGQVDLKKNNYLMVGILSSYVDMKDYYGEDSLFPIYVEVEDGERLQRAINREKAGKGQYAEMCRRFLTDSADFSEDKLKEAGIEKRYQNNDFEECIAEIKKDIMSSKKTND